MEEFKNLIVPGDVYASFVINNSDLNEKNTHKEMFAFVHPSTLILDLLGQCYSIEPEKITESIYIIEMARNVAQLWGADKDYNVATMVYFNKMSDHVNTIRELNNPTLPDLLSEGSIHKINNR